MKEKEYDKRIEIKKKKYLMFKFRIKNEKLIIPI